MLGARWSPPIVPYGADQTVFVVIDRLGGQGSLGQETECERPDAETTIADLLSGKFGDPVRVIAFNTLEHWSDDVSPEIAREIQTRSDIEGIAVPEHIRDFVGSHLGRPVRPHSRPKPPFEKFGAQERNAIYPC